jgi:cytochrome c5
MIRLSTSLFGALALVLLSGCGESTTQADDRSVEALYWQSCASCHSTGRGGAPVAFESEVWSARKSHDDLWFERVTNGYRGMPAKGMCHDCSDEEIQQLIEYITSDRAQP